MQRLGSGVWGLAIGLLGLLILLALVSFRPEDLRGDGASENIIGPVGAWLAYLVLYLFGLAGFLLAAGSLYLAGLLVAQRAVEFRRRHLAGFGVILLPAMILLHLAMPDRSLYPRGAGGLVGYLFASAFHALIGNTGTVLVALAGVLAGVSLMFQVPVKAFFHAPLKWLSATLRSALGRFRKRSEASVSESDEETRPVPRQVRVERADATPDGEPTPMERPGPARAGERGNGNGRNGDADRVEETRMARPDGTAAARAAAAVTAGRAAGAGGDGEGGEADGEPGHGAGGGDAAAAPLIVRDRVSDAALDAIPEGTGKDGEVPIVRSRVAKEPPAEFQLPDLSLLEYVPPVRRNVDDTVYQELARMLKDKLLDFKVDGEVESIHPGPVITLFEFKPGRGIKVAQVANLSKDLAMALAAEQVRVIAPIPGRDVVGIEIPNKIRETVYLRELLGHPMFREGKQRLPLALGKDIAGNPVFSDLTKMPHLLVAGTTGSGKSVLLHSFLMSTLYRLEPRRLKLILVDTKMLELTAYAEIPHLLLPVVTEAKDATIALRWAVGEMERRNRAMSQAGVPNIAEYNEFIRNRRESPHLRAAIRKVTRGPDGAREEHTVEGGPEDAGEEFPYIVVMIDELADLMMVAGKQVETSIVRLAQMARAAGIHMVIATQNPTIKVVTGIIKANMPARVACKVRSMQDSRVILDQNGADDLLGYGDMLFLPPGSSKLQRIHGAFVSTEERARVVEHLRGQGAPEYNFDIMQTGIEEEEADGEAESGADDIYRRAKAYAIGQGKVSTSALQREFGIGYNKAAVIMSRMEKEGLVGPQEAAGKPRVVLA